MTCDFCKEHTEDLTPVGPVCGRPATQVIHWADGRLSLSCDWHGFSALDPLAKMLVARVDVLPGAGGVKP